MAPALLPMQKRADQQDLRPTDRDGIESAPLALTLLSAIWIFLLPKAIESVLKKQPFPIISTETLEGPLTGVYFSCFRRDPFSSLCRFEWEERPSEQS